MPGVWAVGTTATPALFAIGAAGHASTAAIALHADLLEQDLEASGRG
jgi:thioredoxin reductase